MLAGELEQRLQLVASGALGRIYHARACYLQSWGGPDTPLLWRFQGDVAGLLDLFDKLLPTRNYKIPPLED